MSAEERLADWHPARFIELVARCSEALAWQAGVGGCETAGALISYLANHPKDIEPFINGGFTELPLLEMHKLGQLSWHANNGTIQHPPRKEAQLS